MSVKFGLYLAQLVDVRNPVWAGYRSTYALATRFLMRRCLSMTLAFMGTEMSRHLYLRSDCVQTIPAGIRLISRVGDAADSCAGISTEHPTSCRCLEGSESERLGRSDLLYADSQTTDLLS